MAELYMSALTRDGIDILPQDEVTADITQQISG